MRTSTSHISRYPSTAIRITQTRQGLLLIVGPELESHNGSKVGVGEIGAGKINDRRCCRKLFRLMACLEFSSLAVIMGRHESGSGQSGPGSRARA
jgi:hypothetical protein